MNEQTANNLRNTGGSVALRVNMKDYYYSCTQIWFSQDSLNLNHTANVFILSRLFKK